MEVIDKRYTKVRLAVFTNSHRGIGRYFEIQRSNFPFPCMHPKKPVTLHGFLLRNELTMAL
jgi:hypothetical protein